MDKDRDIGLKKSEWVTPQNHNAEATFSELDSLERSCFLKMNVASSEDLYMTKPPNYDQIN